jgi:hypothetical protein
MVPDLLPQLAANDGMKTLQAAGGKQADPPADLPAKYAGMPPIPLPPEVIAMLEEAMQQAASSQ